QCLDREQGVQWIRKERLPLFLQSDCYFEYRLAKLLSQVECSSKGKKLQIDPSYRPWSVSRETSAPPTDDDEHETIIRKFYVSLGQSSVTQTKEWFTLAKQSQDLVTTQSSEGPLSATQTYGHLLSHQEEANHTNGSSSLGIQSAGYLSNSLDGEHSSPSRRGASAHHGAGETPKSTDDKCFVSVPYSPSQTPSTMHLDFKSESGIESDGEDRDEDEEEDEENRRGREEKEVNITEETSAQLHEEATEPTIPAFSTLEDLATSLVNKVLRNCVLQLSGEPESINKMANLDHSHPQRVITVHYHSGLELSEAQGHLPEPQGALLTEDSKGSRKVSQEEETSISESENEESDDDDEDGGAGYRSHDFGSRKGLERFKMFLHGTPGEKYLHLWMDIERLKVTKDTRRKIRKTSAKSENGPGAFIKKPRRLVTANLDPAKSSLSPILSKAIDKPGVTKKWQRAVSARSTASWSSDSTDSSVSESIQENKHNLSNKTHSSRCSPVLGGARMERMLQALHHDQRAGYCFTQFCELSGNKLWKNGVQFWFDLQDYHRQFYQEILNPFKLQRLAQGCHTCNAKAATPTTPGDAKLATPGDAKHTGLGMPSLPHLGLPSLQRLGMPSLQGLRLPSCQACNAWDCLTRNARGCMLVTFQGCLFVTTRGSFSAVVAATTVVSHAAVCISAASAITAGVRSGTTTAGVSCTESSITAASAMSGVHRTTVSIAAASVATGSISASKFAFAGRASLGADSISAASVATSSISTARIAPAGEASLANVTIATDNLVNGGRPRIFLYSAYVRFGAPMDIAADLDTRKQIYQKLDPPFEDLFDPAEEYILTLLLVPWMQMTSYDRTAYKRVELVEETRLLVTVHYRKLQALHKKTLRKQQERGELQPSAPSPPPPPEVPREPNLWEQVSEEYRSYNLSNLLRHRLELEHFRNFLEEHFASMDLMCWLDIEQFRRTPHKEKDKREEKSRDIKSKYLNKKYFFGPNSPATRDQQEQVMQLGGGWGKILHDRLSAPVLVELQKYVRNRIERKWLPLFLSTPEFAERQKMQLKMKNVAEDQIFHTNRKKREVWKYTDSKWVSSSKEIIAFRKALLNPVTCHQFQRFVSLKGDCLENGVLFWLEVQKYKDLCHSHSDDSTIQSKVSTIINCFINSSIPPVLQIDIPPEQAEEIIEKRRELGPYVFREAQMTVFGILFKLWPDFCAFRSNLEETKVLPALERKKEKQLEKLKRKIKEEERRAKVRSPAYIFQ
ncbi:UNVERIFIED_CONTAM: hypothetical protein FKN15_016978, partial [Acipenser sinensis]